MLIHSAGSESFLKAVGVLEWKPSSSFPMPDHPGSQSDLPHISETFGSVRNGTEGFGSVPKASERRESHTLTVREVARMFEAAGVARTERSIINWCQPNKLGVPRLDCYFDPNERRYFITPQSVDLAIKEEQSKAAQFAGAEPVESVPKNAESQRDTGASSSNGGIQNMRELQRDITDLKITNKAKDMFIEQLQGERRDLVDKLMISSHRVGELESKLLQLEPPNGNRGTIG